MNILKRNKSKTILLITTFLTLLTSCNNNIINEDQNIFSESDFINKYHLNDSNTYGNLSTNNYEIKFEYLPFLEKESKNYSRGNNKNENNDDSLVQIGTFSYKNATNEISFGQFYATNSTTSSNVDYLVTNIINDFSLISSPDNYVKFIGDWENRFNDSIYLNLEKDGKFYGIYQNKVKGVYTKDELSHNYILLNEGYFTPSKENNIRTKKIRLSSNSEDRRFLRGGLPNTRWEDDVNKTDYFTDFYPTSNFDPNNYMEVKFTFPKGSPVIKSGVDWYDGIYVNYEFINPSSNNEPYYSISSEKFGYLSFFHYEKLLTEEKELNISLNGAIEALEGSGSIFIDKYETFSFSKTYTFN